MRILIAYRYFAPDTPPYASMLDEMTSWFAQAGHEVEMVTAQPSYKPEAGIPKQPWREDKAGVSVRRVWLLPEKGMGLAKVANSALFVLRAFFIVLFGRKRDVVWTATQPPVVQAWMLSWAAKLRGAKFLYHMQDIHPEIGAISDGELKKGRLYGALLRMDVAAQNRARQVVVLSPDMADVIRDRGATPGDVRVIRNFALGDDAASGAVAGKSSGPARFVFAGNIGRFQNLEALVAAFAALDPAQVQLVFVGEGRAKPKLQEMVAQLDARNIEFHAHMSEQAVFTFLQQQDVGLVSLSPGLYRYAFPSKIWTYMAAGLPMLALVERESDVTHFLESNAIGRAVPWGAPEGALAEAVITLAQEVRAGRMDPSQRKDLFHRSAARAHWLALLEELS